VVWVFVSRWNENRRVERVIEAQRARDAREITEKYGSGGLQILRFYATPGVIARGQKALLCYGVANAKTVRIEPAPEHAWPSLSRCFEITPARETRYTLIAEDAEGHAAKQSFVLYVK